MKHRRVGRLTLLVSGLIAVLIGAGCTKSSDKDTESPTTEFTTQTITRSPSIGQTGAISTGAITEKLTTACPLIGVDQASNDAGIRLDKIVSLSQSGREVGCRFYPLEKPNGQCSQTCLSGERLPPGNVPGIEIVLSQYASAIAARNAFVRIATAGTDYLQTHVAAGNTGLCYKTTLWERDAGQDWACTFSKGSTVVVIRTVVNRSSLNVQDLAQAIYPKVK